MARLIFSAEEVARMDDGEAFDVYARADGSVDLVRSRDNHYCVYIEAVQIESVIAALCGARDALRREGILPALSWTEVAA